MVPIREPYQSLKSTIPLASTPLFQPRYGTTRRETFQLSYERARVINQHHGFTINDIIALTPRFWEMHMDGIILADIGAHAMLSIQHNLVVGTIAAFAGERADVKELMKQILNFEVSAGFMLTEVEHGLDAKNLETTATLESDGSFILHSPTPGAGKFVPPSMPVAGIPRIAVVMARLIVGEEEYGVRPFLVGLSDGKEMCKGVTSSLLPELSGSQSPYAITSFDRVCLPSNALLGSLEKPADMRAHFWTQIGRISIGTLAMSLIMIPSLKCVTYIVGKYSYRRAIHGPGKTKIPIISFRTQQLPILHAVAQLNVMEPFAKQMITWFKDPAFKPEVRHGFAVILKAVFLHYGQRSIPQLVERCGAQGLFQHNQICDADNLVRAAAISEGDAMVLSIRLAVELFLGRYEMPRPANPDSLLAKLEAGLAEECLEIVETIPEGHRSQEFNRLLIPRCRPIVEAIGHRMVYDVAIASGVDPDLIALYEIGIVKENLSWYVESGLLTRATVNEMENKALDAVLPRLDHLLDRLNIAPYCTAPIITGSMWEDFVGDLEEHKGNSNFDLFKINDGQQKMPKRSSWWSGWRWWW